MASKGGAPTTRSGTTTWWPTRRPSCIQDGPEPFEVAVRQVTGEEKESWWDRAVAAYPPYAEYQANTEREIPVFVASRKRR